MCRDKSSSSGLEVEKHVLQSDLHARIQPRAFVADIHGQDAVNAIQGCTNCVSKDDWPCRKWLTVGISLGGVSWVLSWPSASHPIILNQPSSLEPSRGPLMQLLWWRKRGSRSCTNTLLRRSHGQQVPLSQRLGVAESSRCNLAAGGASEIPSGYSAGSHRFFQSWLAPISWKR